MISAFDDAFNVSWEDPKDAESIWAIDRIHFAHPVAPLAEELYRRIIERSWATPCVFVNGYAYLKDFAPPPTPEEVIERGAATVWREDYLPRVRQLCSDLRERDYDSMSAPDLVDQLPQLFDESAEAFKYPTVVASAFMGPGLMLAAFCEREIGPDGPVLVASLLQGFANDSIAAGVSLGELASFAQSRPEVAAALRERRYDDIPSLPGGDEFMASLGAYLDTYGWRAEEWSLVHRPTWTEDPKTPLFLISRYVEDPARSPAESMRRAVEQREAAEREIESRLPEDKRPEFRKMLEAAHRHVQVSEERALWQLIAIGSVRVPVLALGGKLVEAGALDQPDDAFYLTLDELRRLAADPTPARDLVAQRRAEQDRREAMQPPASIGRPLVVADRPPQSQIVHRFFFGTTLEPGEGKQLKGTGASRGVVTGPARVIRSLSESDALQAGEILVCRNTAPPWTPLFAIAAAVVTDIGGLLSHSAICAREYAIPCVVGTGTATTRIADGDLITVDGAAGTVTIE